MSPADAHTTPMHSRFLGLSLLRDWPFVVLYALAVVGVSLTTSNAGQSAEYWQLLIIVTALVSIVSGYALSPAGERRTMLFKQLLHWAALLVVVRLLFMHSLQDFLSDESDGFVVIYLLGLAAIMGGIHWNWRLIVFGLFLIATGIGLALFEENVLILSIVAAVVALAATYALARFKGGRSPSV